MRSYISIPLEEYVSQKQLDKAIAERDELAERFAELQEQARVAEENHKFVVEQGLRQRDQAVSLADTLRQERDKLAANLEEYRECFADLAKNRDELWSDLERVTKERDDAKAEVARLLDVETGHRIAIAGLTAERDEARAEVCAHEADTSEDQQAYAKMCGGRCFPHTDGASYPENPDNSQQALDRLAKLAIELREVKRERDEARRMFCKLHVPTDAAAYAEGLGWDCFKEDAT